MADHSFHLGPETGRDTIDAFLGDRTSSSSCWGLEVDGAIAPLDDVLTST